MILSERVDSSDKPTRAVGTGADIGERLPGILQRRTANDGAGTTTVSSAEQVFSKNGKRLTL